MFEILKFWNFSIFLLLQCSYYLISLRDFMSNCCGGCSKCLRKKSSNDSILSLTSLIWQIFGKENTISKRFGWCPSKSSAHCRTLHFNVPYRLIWTWTTTARVRHVFIFLESENIEKEWWKSCLWKFITSIKSNCVYECTYIRNFQVCRYFLEFRNRTKNDF